MPATKKVRVDRALSTNNDSDASVASFLTVTSGAPGFNTTTGVISIPNNTSQLTNGAGFITSSALSGYQTTLVSGTSIKTINGNSLLGSGDISISAGSSLPSQTGNSGKYLTTDGSNLSWGAVSGGGGTDYSTATAIKIGSGAGTNQNAHSIAIGQNAGSAQSFEAIAIGYAAGTNQAHYTVAIGDNAASNNQSVWGISIGYMAGYMNQGASSVAIGTGAGQSQQGANSVAIGAGAGGSAQGSNSIAIGAGAGSNSQYSNSIVLNASPNALDSTGQGFFVAPIRSDATPSNIIYYNTVTKEMTYGAAPTGSSGGSGGSSAGGLDQTQFSASSNPPEYLSSSYTMPWTPPSASGTTLVFLIPPPWVPVVNAGQNMTGIMASHGNINPPWASWYYGSVMGPQIASFGSQATGYGLYNAYILHSSTNPATDSNYFGSLAADLNVNTGDVTILNPGGMMGWTPSVAGYGYFTVNASSMGGGGPPSGFTPAAGVTAWFDSVTSQVMVKAPPSVWWNNGSGSKIGTFTGLTPMQSYTCMVSGAFFGT